MAYSEATQSTFEVEINYTENSQPQSIVKYVLAPDSVAANTKATEWANDAGRTFVNIMGCNRRITANLT